ncbi:MAG: large repetitive protein [Thermoleophilaceae bacterium]|nr:large repetitive protein [Thermoleophilaceae bacterium]
MNKMRWLWPQRSSFAMRVALAAVGGFVAFGELGVASASDIPGAVISVPSAGTTASGAPVVATGREVAFSNVVFHEDDRGCPPDCSETLALTSASWSFGDGGTSSDLFPKHRFAAPGLYEVQLEVRFESGRTATSRLWLTVRDPGTPLVRVLVEREGTPRAGSPVRFLADPWEEPLVPDPDPVIYAWDLDGDGATDSTEAEPTRTYSTAGHRTASLVVTFADGRTAAGSATFTVHGEGSFVALVLHTPTPVPGTPVRWARGAPGLPNRLQFGDGTEDTGTDFSVSHPYAQTGDYVATLTTALPGAQGTSVDKVSVPVREAVAPLASARCDRGDRGPGHAVECRSDVADPDDFATSYAWDFGDGQTSTEQNPSHAYTQPGDYTATVTTQLRSGQSVTTKAAVQIVDLAPAIAAFAMPAEFRAAPSGASVAAARRRARVGAVVRYRLSEPARLTLTVERRAAGRKVGKRCRKPSRGNRTRKRCTRWVRERGSFTHAGVAGQNRFKFTGRLRNRKLKPGSYRLVAVATDSAGNRSPAKRRTFRIVR